MKVLVAHPMRQHSFQLATALKRAGILSNYVTTVYLKPRSLTSLVAKVLPPFWRKKATGRHCLALDNSDVVQICEAGGLAVLLCHNIPLFRGHFDAVRRRVEDRFGKKVAELAISTGVDAVIGYDGVSSALFEEVKRLSPETMCIADMSAANALYLKKIYERDAALKPDYADSLYGWNRIWDSIDIGRTESELANADGFLCGSLFVKRSLEFSGIAPDCCKVIHYGVDAKAFPFREREVKSEANPLVFVYLGQVAEHKGLSWLFEAFRDIPMKAAKLICIGAVNLPESVISSLSSNIELKGMVQHDEVSDLLLSADVMLFPSLGDGFGLAVTEGFASGLPVVCSDNTGAADVIVEGANGFVVPTQDAGALKEKIVWFLSNRDEIPRMAACARESVMALTWDAYYEYVADAVEALVKRGCRE